MPTAIYLVRILKYVFGDVGPTWPEKMSNAIVIPISQRLNDVATAPNRLILDENEAMARTKPFRHLKGLEPL